MTNLNRRDLFRLSATTGAAVAVGASAATFLGQLPAGAMPLAGYGPLVPDPAGIVDLPAGFTYRVLGASASAAANAVPATFLKALGGAASSHAMPSKADGAAVFGIGGGRIAYVLNHENTNDLTGAVPKTAEMVDAAKVYNPAVGLASGGCTTIVLDAGAPDADGFPTVVEHVVSIAGTVKNCAGGATPWGTWLTCEETESTIAGMPHGYVFEVDPADAATVATPYVAMGRMNHEAAAVDPATGNVYLTEDASGPRGLVYRFVPNDTSGTYGSLGNGGVLAAMCCTTAGGQHVPDLADVHAIGAELRVGWMTVAEPNPTAVPIRAAFTNEQVTRARKFEGAWWSAGTAWIVSSYSKTGEYVPGTEHQGQVWRYDPAAETLTLVWIAEPGTPFNGPDNIVTTPHGGALLCEDGDNPNKLLVGIVGDGVDGTGFALARNMYNGSEFAGADFTPDGQTLIVNAYAPGLTVAIRGPWVGGPPPVVPEVPAAVALPVAAGLTIAGASWFHQRKNRLAAS